MKAMKLLASAIQRCHGRRLSQQQRRLRMVSRMKKLADRTHTGKHDELTNQPLITHVSTTNSLDAQEASA